VRFGLFLLLWSWVSLAQAVTVVASIEPLAMLAREVLGDEAEVSTLLLPNQTPHFAAFTPGQARQVRDAELVIWLGHEAEPNVEGLVDKAHGRTLALLDLPQTVRRYGDAHEHEGHAHHDSELDPHLWLAPDNAVRLADALLALAPQLGVDANAVAQRHDAFVKKLAQRRADWQQQFAPLHDTPWLTQHNPWGYLVDEWQLHEPLMVSASLQGSASARRFAELVQQMRAQNVRCAVAEPEAQRALLARLCQGECRIVDIDPLGRDLAGQGYVDFLQHIATRLQTCLAPAL